MPGWLTRSERKLLHQLIKVNIAALADIATTVALGAVDRLITHGLVMLSCFTPTDAVHVLGQFDGFDAYLQNWAHSFGAPETGAGEPLAANGRSRSDGD